MRVCNFITQVKERVLEGTNISSESTVIHSFAPPNMHKMITQYYTGRINLKHAFQRKQLHAFQINSQWCSALYGYLRKLAVQNRDNCVFISCDNKVKVDFDEPSAGISSGVRGKKSIIPTSSFLGALGHDVNQKCYCCKFIKCKKYFKVKIFSRDLVLGTLIICSDCNGF